MFDVRVDGLERVQLAALAGLRGVAQQQDDPR